VARLASREARYLLRKHLAHADLSQDLTVAVHAASEDLRASALFTTDWSDVQAQLLRVLPVVQKLLRTLASLKQAPTRY
jgi:hypothetical protein